MEIDYDVERVRKTLSTQEFYDRFSNYDEVQGHCKDCPRYDTNYSCSPIEDDPREYILNYDYVDIIKTQIFFKKEDYTRDYSKEEFDSIIDNTFHREREITVAQIKEEEASMTHAMSIIGPCNVCASDCKKQYDKCLHPEIRRYSLASLGIDSQKILKEVFGIELILLSKHLPKYMNNLTTLLYSK
ncbi:MAG: DUF2284 domain-containing protein [Methanosphaera sp.]|nr:DUF2284 domain-containing protein [Methanosphaera sp.]